MNHIIHLPPAILKSLAVLLMASCCNKPALEADLARCLDAKDVRGALKDAENPCLSGIDGIRTLRAVLLFRLRLDEKNPKQREEIKSNAISLLREDAAAGHSGAISILNCYSKRGDEFWISFPWGGVLGHGSYPGQKRSRPEM